MLTTGLWFWELTLLDALGDKNLQEIVLLKMKGDTNEEIAEQISGSSRTVRRNLQTIRKVWLKTIAEDDPDFDINVGL